MIFGALRVLNGVPKGGIKPSEVKPTPVHSGVAWLIVIISVIVIGVMMVTGLSNGLLTACIIGFSALILGSLFVRGVSESSPRRVQELDIPAPRPAPTPASMRARADQLARPKPEPQAEPEVVPEPRQVMTFKQVREDRDLDERMRRIACILISACPACGAGEAEFCTFLPDEPTYMLDRDRTIVVHGKRIGNAIKQHTAKVTEVVAQFDNHVPDDVWEAAL
jgi:hypothetical protein